MDSNLKSFLIRAGIFILLILLFFPFIRHFFVPLQGLYEKINVVYYTEMFALIFGIFLIILFLIIKDNPPKIKKYPKIKLASAILAVMALLLLFSTFMLEADMEKYLQMDAVYVGGDYANVSQGDVRYANIGYGGFLGDRIKMNYYLSLSEIEITKLVRVENPEAVIRWHGLWSGQKNFSAIMIVNNITYNITPAYLSLEPNHAGWLELNASNLHKGLNEIVMSADNNDSRVVVASQWVYHDRKTSPLNRDGLLLYATAEHSNTERTLTNFKPLIKILAIIFLFLAVFGVQSSSELIIRKETVFALVFSYLVYFVSYKIQDYWMYFSSSATKISYIILRLFSSNAVSSGTNLGIAPFIVKINEQCSGIEGLAFFTIMSILIIAIDWNKMDKKKLWLIPLGLVGMFLVNCIRITLIILIGKYISADFAINTVHTNIGWILFILYFVVFWYFAYSWMKKK